ncbi:hypothetical protein NPIL_120201, partial [Nephila pilipes]
LLYLLKSGSGTGPTAKRYSYLLYLLKSGSGNSPTTERYSYLLHLLKSNSETINGCNDLVVCCSECQWNLG